MRDGIWFAGLGGGVVALGVSVSLVSATLADVVHERDRLRAAAARPTPTVTVTAARQAPSPDRTLTTSRTVEAAQPSTRAAPDRTAGAGPGRAAGQSASTPEHPRPSPSPAPRTPAEPAEPASCSGGVLVVRLPLGVLPCNAITIGGTR